MNFQRVKISPEESQKYIFGYFSEGDKVTSFLWGNANAEWHKDIAKEMVSAGFPTLRIEGGGRIKLLVNLKTIYFWDKSAKYGSAPLQDVKKLLEEFFPGWNLIDQTPFEEFR